MSTAAKTAIQSYWMSKSLAGIVLGLPLALVLGGLFAWIGPGGIHAVNKDQVVMWTTCLLWPVILSVVYLFRTGTRAWLWLGTVNLAAWAALYFTRFMSGS